jgi:hypothetical protein
MTDIFISYAREDREQAQKLAAVLEDRGWTVWWDRNIPIGKPFDTVIADALAAAKCVIVLWSKDSVASHWVTTEAAEGRERGALVPLRLDRKATIPLEFKRLQTADLTDWFARDDAPDLPDVFERIAALTGGRGANGGGGPGGGGVQPPRRPNPRVRSILLFIVVPTLAVVLGAAGLMAWKVPTEVQWSFQAQRLEMRLAGTADVPLFDPSPGFSRVILELFAEVDMLVRPGGLETVPKAGEPLPISFPADRALPLRIQVSEASSSKITFGGHAGNTAPPSKADIAVRVGDLKAKPGAKLAVYGTDGVAWLHLVDQTATLSLLQESPLEFKTQAVAFDPPVQIATAAETTRFRAYLADGASIVSAKSLPASFKLGFVIRGSAAHEGVKILANAPVKTMAARRDTEDGSAPSSVVGPVTLTYVDEPEVTAVKLTETSMPDLASVGAGLVSLLTFDPTSGVFSVEFKGRLDGPPPAGFADYRLSVFDRFRYGRKMLLLVSVGAWVASVLVGLYKLVSS